MSRVAILDYHFKLPL